IDSGAFKAGTRQTPVVRNPLACDVHVLLVGIGHDDRPLQAERDPVPPGRLVGPQPVMAETVRLYRAEVEQFRIVCHRTKRVFPPDRDQWVHRNGARPVQILRDGGRTDIRRPWHDRYWPGHAAAAADLWQGSDTRTPLTHGYAATREAAMAAFAKSWASSDL